MEQRKAVRFSWLSPKEGTGLWIRSQPLGAMQAARRTLHCEGALGTQRPSCTQLRCLVGW